METEQQQIERIFADSGITVASDNEYLVPSSDGKRTYTVKFEGCPEWMEPEVQTWSCTCPAGGYEKTCKHINAVSSCSDLVCDILGYE